MDSTGLRDLDTGLPVDGLYARALNVLPLSIVAARSKFGSF